ncbi:Crp/Fnr family transcriptional regulator [Zhongshania aquimaris]|uniref:Crp/Fnr family transcriptional regulator n=1 Tax=Zhongshania aquimaris TaxID=2857107 RepID=A0ABS6VW32_9GAMM|nr:Crp/Fnr family transcriptional regulator [Zhongshania aquimaris]MBW2942545.1 Crp/Fnr family transcriptional regulator [Zhongshania aquimaris]
MKSQALELINCWSWFQFLPEEAKSRLAEQCRLINVDKGEALYRHNDALTHVYGLISGGVRIYVSSADGSEMTLEEVAAGAWFPHFLAKQEPTNFGNATATNTSTLVAINKKDFLEVGERWPELYRGLYNEFVARGVVTIGRMELLTLHSLNVRIAVYLLRLLVTRGTAKPDNTYYIEPFGSQSEIANRVGGARQRVNSILKEWERKAIISIDRNGLLLKDPNYLVAITADSGFDVEAYLGAWQGGWKSPFHKDSGFSVRLSRSPKT